MLGSSAPMLKLFPKFLVGHRIKYLHRKQLALDLHLCPSLPNQPNCSQVRKYSFPREFYCV